jgi:hypothetical protein
MVAGIRGCCVFSGPHLLEKYRPRYKKYSSSDTQMLKILINKIQVS